MTSNGNIAFTAKQSIITFIDIDLAGIKALGWKYINTIVFWPHDMPLAMKLPITFILTPIELAGKFTKPIALAIRLFANMIAGHIVVLALISLIFTFASYWLAPAPVAMALEIMVPELVVDLLDAFVLALL